MGRYQSVQNALISINETVFQDLCDNFLFARGERYIAFSRTGSQVGKQKTIKGTPDSYFLLENGKYVFVEYSTNVTQGVEKLLKDINKCLDPEVTGIPSGCIAKIILCFNFNLKPYDTQRVFDIVQDTGIDVQLYSLDTIAQELCLNYRNLVSEYLNLPFDTGQVVSIDRFIAEYNTNSQSISTPLDNSFHHREVELEELKTIISEENLIILNGAPGVGKTKLAIETIRNFIKENKSYNAYCISYKNSSLIEDLSLYLNANKDYVLFVDDANRIDNIGQIIGFYKQSRNGNLKIVITVRDYAYSTIKRIVSEFSYKEYTVTKFTDEQIIDIVKDSPFNILNQHYHKEIVRIADGNPRLAIMTALLAIEKQDLRALHNVSDLFDNYFSTFIKDDGKFEEPLNIKILGMLAFFFALPYKDKEIMLPILESFAIDYDEFFEHIDELERLELLEIQYDYVKIPEQNVSTYFFYKAFIKDNLLSFETLLNKFFDNNISRFRDCIIPANNNFGYENVIEKIKPELSRYLESIIKDEERTYNFLSMFWVYLQDETLNFVYGVIENMPSNGDAVYMVSYDTNDIAFSENRIIGLLGLFFRYQNRLSDSIELAFEFVRKQPQYLPKLIHKIRETLTFDCNDAGTNFNRQRILFEKLIGGVYQKDELYCKAFYELSKTFLLFQFEHTEAARNHSFRIYYYQLPLDDSIKNFRKNIWECINTNFTEDAFELLENYSQISPDVIKEIMDYDMAFVCEIVEQHMLPHSLSHCKFVNELIQWYKRNGYVSSLLDSLSNKFFNPLYEMYLKMNWDRLRDKEIFDYDNYVEYEQLKEAEIRENFVFDNKSKIEAFYNDFVCIISSEKKDNNNYSYRKVLDIVVDETFFQCHALGIYLLTLIISNNPIGYIPDRLFRKHLINESNARYIWSAIHQGGDFVLLVNWEMAFYQHLPDSLTNAEYADFLRDTIFNWNSKYYLDLRIIEKFTYYKPNFLEELMKIIVQKIEVGHEVYILNHIITDAQIQLLETNIELVKKVYFLQTRIDSHFDYDGELFVNILKREPCFLFEYIKTLYVDDYNLYSKDLRRDLGIIWEIEDVEKIIEQIFDMLASNVTCYAYAGDISNSFFVKILRETEPRAVNFLLEYLKKNYNNPARVNIVVNVVKNRLTDYYKQILLMFLSLTQDKELFSKIEWCSLESIYSGDVNIGDIEATKWNNVLSIVNQSDLGYKLIPIKDYVNSNIEYWKRYTEAEKKRRFVQRDY